MKYKPYRSYKDVVCDLKLLVGDCQKRGETVLPAERQLSELLQTSRITARKAMKELEREGIVQRKQKATVICPQTPATGSFLFITSGAYNVFWQQAFEDLWLQLTENAAEYSLKPELLLYDENAVAADLINEAEKHDIIIITDVLDGVRDDFLPYLQRETHRVVSPNEVLWNSISNIICLDNAEVGRLAANVLIDNGFRKPAFIGVRREFEYIPFEKRCDGFVDVLIKQGLYDEDSVRWLYVDFYPDYVFKAREEIKRLVADGFDSVFLFSDEYISLICADILRSDSKMKKIGVVTLVSSHDALRICPPVPCVDHATEGVADKLIKRMLGMLNGKKKRAVKTLVKPEVIVNTLRTGTVDVKK